MGYIILILLATLLVIYFLMGNYLIIDAVCGGDAFDDPASCIMILVAVVIDIILLCLVIKEIKTPVSSSFQLMRNGLKNRKIAKKESAKLKKFLKNEKLDINRLEELRDKRISESATKQTLHFCQLIEAIAGKEHLQACLSEVGERQSVLDEIDDIESRIFSIAESYKNVGDTEKCKYYLGILKSTNIITPKIKTLENECDNLLSLREKERKAIRSWKGVFLAILTVLIAISMVLYVEDTPYRNLRSMIKKQSLTAAMCDWDNRNSEDSYYYYLKSEKGHKFLATELTKLHREDDINKAMWLLCIQPDCIDGYHLCASPSFIKWIVEFAKTKGVRSTDQDGPNDRYNVIYHLNAYKIIIDSSDDKKSDLSDISGFVIYDDEGQTRVNARYENLKKANISTIK